MNIKVLEEKLKTLELRSTVENDYIQCQIIEAQMELLKTIIFACSLQQ
jgi:hypothetical protein